MTNFLDEVARAMIGPSLDTMKQQFENGLSQVPTAALAPYATEDIASDEQLRELFFVASRALIVRAARLELARRLT